MGGGREGGTDLLGEFSIFRDFSNFRKEIVAESGEGGEESEMEFGLGEGDRARKKKE